MDLSSPITKAWPNNLTVLARTSTAFLIESFIGNKRVDSIHQGTNSDPVFYISLSTHKVSFLLGAALVQTCQREIDATGTCADDIDIDTAPALDSRIQTWERESAAHPCGPSEDPDSTVAIPWYMSSCLHPIGFWGSSQLLPQTQLHMLRWLKLSLHFCDYFSPQGLSSICLSLSLRFHNSNLSMQQLQLMLRCSELFLQGPMSGCGAALVLCGKSLHPFPTWSTNGKGARRMVHCWTKWIRRTNPGPGMGRFKCGSRPWPSINNRTLTETAVRYEPNIYIYIYILCIYGWNSSRRREILVAAFTKQ